MTTTSHARRLLSLAFATTLGSIGTLVVVTGAGAGSTRRFVLDDAADFDRADLQGAAVYSDGRVARGVGVLRLALPEAAVAWSLVRVGDAMYVGTGNDGRIYRVRQGSVERFAETGQMIVTALAAGDDGTLYAGTVPEGRIYAVARDGAVRELAKPDGVEHVWALAYDARKRTLFAATGPEGRVFAIPRGGDPAVYYDATASHVMSLALDSDGTLYAGTNDAALVVALRGPGVADVIADLSGNEVTALDVREGVVVATSNELPDPPRASTPNKATKGDTTSRPRNGKGKLVRIDPTGRVDVLAESADSHYTSVELLPDGVVYAGLGREGRVVRVDADGLRATWVDVDERQVLGLAMEGPAPSFVTGDAGAFYRIVDGERAEATWTSKPLDAKFVARFGELVARGDASIRLTTRSGNTEEPNDTWSAWSAPIANAGPIRSPAARFLQVRATFPADPTATLRALTAYYLPANQRARIANVRLKSPPNSGAATPPERTTSLTLTWDVTNPDDDALRFRVRYRGDEQSQFREATLDHEPLTKTEYSWETRDLPDGYYVVEVEARDELDNPTELALSHRAQSEPILIDHRPPRVDGLRLDAGRLTGTAIDALGPISRLVLVVDGRDPRPLHPADDLLDTARERFDATLDLSPGEHIVTVHAYDAAGNVGSAEIVVSRR